ncbi:MAG: SusF/SusE family outer membrane protein [Bacteroidales bacterium]|nr:SusF/SusE family outer membrane protein [Bacteroidales bacterium]
MKKTKFKSLLNLSWFFLLALIIASTACDKDDDEDDKDNNTVIVEDGTYVLGNSTSYTALTVKGKMADGEDDVTEALRDGMYVKYISVSATGDGFNAVIKAGATETTYGPATNASDADLIQRGTLGTSGVFSVPTDGLYYFCIDVSSNTYFIAPAMKWGIIGQSVGDWGSDIELTAGTWSKDAMSWETTDIEMREGAFKFRQVGSWKVVMGDYADYAANTNFGGVLSGTLPDLTTTMVNGGDNYELGSDQEGMYTVALAWSSEDGFSSDLTKTADVEPPPEYFEELFMIGEGVSDWSTNLPMVAVYGNPQLFWKIVWITEGLEFKFRPDDTWGGDEFGYDTDAGNGEYTIGETNLTVTTTGYYMVVVDLELDKISVVAPTVYLIGDCVGGWDQALEANIFTVGDPSLTITKDLLDGELRMYAAHSYFADWWHVEFMIFDNVIEFRADGNDQDRIDITAGSHTIELNFITGAGSITQ